MTCPSRKPRESETHSAPPTLAPAPAPAPLAFFFATREPALQMCKLMWAQPEIDLPKQVVEHAKEAAFSGVLPTRAGGGINSAPPPRMMGPPNKLARVAGPPPIGGGRVGGGDGATVVGGAGVGSLQMPHRQQQQPMPMQMQGGPQFDAPPGFLFEIESQVRTGEE